MTKDNNEKTHRATKRRVTFAVEAAPGKLVSIAGSFNDWDPRKKTLEYKESRGIYSGVMTLEPGTYEYKFVVDGEWRLDENNPNFSHNDFGTLNSMLIVE